MKKILFFTSLLAGLISPKAWSYVKISFTPSLECEKNIIDLIDQSKHTIDIAVYSINNLNIINALYRAKERNVSLRILTDKAQASGKYSGVREMYKNGLNIRVHSKHKIEHNKFAVFDGQTLLTGSYNWTQAASQKNSENCLFLIEEPDKAAIYQKRFEMLWSLNSAQKSNKWFEEQN